MNENAIATYHESTIMGKREFVLYEKHIEIRVRLLGRPHADVRYELKKIDPNFMRTWVRPGPFSAGVVAMIFSAFVFVSWQSIDPENVSRAMEVAGALFTLGLIVALATVKKVEYVAFLESAKVVLLDVGKSGPDEKSFGDFVQKLVAQIEKVRLQ